MFPRGVPTDLPQLPTDLPQHTGSGLSVGATIGIGIGIALVVLFCAVGAWIYVRRRRRTWASKKRKQDEEAIQRDVKVAHITPDEEIARKVREYEKHIKLWDGKRGGEDEVKSRVLGWEESDDEEKEKDGERDVEKAYELASPVSPIIVEVRNAQVAIGGKAFAVEMEGCSVVEAKARQEKIDGKGEEKEGKAREDDSKKVYEIGQ
ncbi:hypothetical protein IQ06DRAFT_354084 [Phaeosphaeriaceae sp. SRC1lsM3a]|nr:hypothetical protein IQ06DRAFT_354084 [Stagonospora sp. SRC1lsM3a]